MYDLDVKNFKFFNSFPSLRLRRFLSKWLVKVKCDVLVVQEI